MGLFEFDLFFCRQIGLHGTGTWSLLALALPARTGKQCRDRWKNHLDPNINKLNPWTLEEDKLLANLHKQFKNRWVEIAKHLPGSEPL